jgi:hypothetical protein
MHPSLADAIRAHVERYEMEDVLVSALICCETTSTRQKKKLFGSKTEVEIAGVVLTPKWLIWAGGKENEGPGALSARLQNLRVEDHEKSSMYKLIPDTGLHVYGFPVGDELGSIFIGLGPEPAAQKFRDTLKEAIAKV